MPGEQEQFWCIEQLLCIYSPNSACLDIHKLHANRFVPIPRRIPVPSVTECCRSGWQTTPHIKGKLKVMLLLHKQAQLLHFICYERRQCSSQGFWAEVELFSYRGASSCKHPRYQIHPLNLELSRPGASTVLHRHQCQASGWQRCFLNFRNYFRRKVWRECSKFRNIYFDVACFSPVIQTHVFLFKDD